MLHAKLFPGTFSWWNAGHPILTHTWEHIPFQDQVTIADIISVTHVQAFLEFQDWNMY